VETFDGLTYAVKIGAGSNGDYPLTVSVAGNSAVTKQSPAGQLAADKQFEGWTYQVPEYALDSLLKPKDQLLVAVNANLTNAAPSSVEH
jgi:hypothetical protein